MKDNGNGMKLFLERASRAYYEGSPIISDKEFDTLAATYTFDRVGYDTSKGIPHYKRMYSLQKVYDDEPSPLSGPQVESPKLDGAAVSLLYHNGEFIRGLTRGDGSKGQDVTDNLKYIVPSKLVDMLDGFVQVTGEVVAPKEIDNARNYAAGALSLKDGSEFKARELTFVLYDSSLQLETYRSTLELLQAQGFTTILSDNLDIFPTDGIVFRINSTKAFNELGYTAKHPKGAYALKKRSDVAIEKTVLREVIWQTGASGKVTPVAIFDEVTIDDARITRATLNNAGFIEDMGLDIGDTILVTRAGGIIPKVLGNK